MSAGVGRADLVVLPKGTLARIHDVLTPGDCTQIIHLQAHPPPYRTNVPETRSHTGTHLAWTGPAQ